MLWIFSGLLFLFLRCKCNSSVAKLICATCAVLRVGAINFYYSSVYYHIKEHETFEDECVHIFIYCLYMYHLSSLCFHVYNSKDHIVYCCLTFAAVFRPCATPSGQFMFSLVINRHI